MPKKRGNGEGSVVRYKDGYRAIIVTGWRDQTHPIKHTKTGFATVKEARDYIHSFNRNEVAPMRSATTVSDYWYIFSHNGLEKLSSSKQTHYRTVWNRISEVAQEPMSSLTVARLQELVKGYTYYPARDIKSLLSHLFKLAIADGEVTINLSQYIVLPELVEEETVPFSSSEVERMWEDFTEHPVTGLALVMCYTGMMPGELVQVKEANINWTDNTITGVGVKTDRRKTAAIVFPERIKPVLRSLLEVGKNNGLLPYKMDTYRREFKEMVKRIGADSRCTPYSCRHTFATMLSAQVPAHILAKLMRNDIRVTQKYYLHEDNNLLLNEVNRALG